MVTKLYEFLKVIRVDGEQLDFASATVKVIEDNVGLKEWDVHIEGAETRMASIMYKTNKVKLLLISNTGNEYSGDAIPVNDNRFKGTGRLFGFE